jgi:hypothetical protein
LLKGGGQLNKDPSALLSPISYRNSAGAGRLIKDNSIVMLGSMNGGGSDVNVASHKLFLTAGKEDKNLTNSHHTNE